MIPWSVFIWLIFEAANLFLKNWYYVNLPCSILERWLGYATAYGTVLPGLFETTELLETFGLFKNWQTVKSRISSRRHNLLACLGGLCLISSLLIPRIFLPSHLGRVYFSSGTLHLPVWREIAPERPGGGKPKAHLFSIGGGFGLRPPLGVLELLGPIQMDLYRSIFRGRKRF